MIKELCQVTKNLEIKKFNTAGAHHSKKAEEGKLIKELCQVTKNLEIKKFNILEHITARKLKRGSCQILHQQ